MSWSAYLIDWVPAAVTWSCALIAYASLLVVDKRPKRRAASAATTERRPPGAVQAATWVATPDGLVSAKALARAVAPLRGDTSDDALRAGRLHVAYARRASPERETILSDARS